MKGEEESEVDGKNWEASVEFGRLRLIDGGGLALGFDATGLGLSL